MKDLIRERVENLELYLNLGEVSTSFTKMFPSDLEILDLEDFLIVIIPLTESNRSEEIFREIGIFIKELESIGLNLHFSSFDIKFKKPDISRIQSMNDIVWSGESPMEWIKSIKSNLPSIKDAAYTSVRRYNPQTDRMSGGTFLSGLDVNLLSYTSLEEFNENIYIHQSYVGFILNGNGDQN